MLDYDELRDEFTQLSRQELAAGIAAENWFHDVAFGTVRTRTRAHEDWQPPNYHLWPMWRYLESLDLVDARCLDVGTLDGMTAFALADLGAASVAASCQYDLDRFRLGRAMGEFTIRYLPGTDLGDLTRTQDPASFDLVVMSAMLHHLISPLEGLLQARRLLTRNGCLLLEAAVTKGDGAANYLNTELDDPIFGAPTLWVPTMDALEGMMRLACFEPVARVQLAGGRRAREVNYERYTWLCRAVSPDQVSNRSAKLQEIHAQASHLGPLELGSLANSAVAPTSLEYTGPIGPGQLNIWQHKPTLRLQPQWTDPEPAEHCSLEFATQPRFRELVTANPDGAFDADDLFLMSANYPGETVPEGMTWSLKQVGNLHILDWVVRWGLGTVLEVGAGFNHYFENHLDGWVSYDIVDDPGFYEAELIALSNARRKRGRAFNGLMGDFDPEIAENGYDCTCSISVLEHVPSSDIGRVSEDLYRVTAPGGWTLHSIDVSVERCNDISRKWAQGFEKAGFLMPTGFDAAATFEPALKDHVITESLAIQLSFYGGYKPTIWTGKPPTAPPTNYVTLLVALRKPLAG